VKRFVGANGRVASLYQMMVNRTRGFSGAALGGGYALELNHENWIKQKATKPTKETESLRSLHPPQFAAETVVAAVEI
jgi:hypothetical protein